MGVRLMHPPALQRPRQTAVKRGTATCWPHCPPPCAGQHYTERKPQGQGKGEPGWTSSFPGIVDHFLGAPTLVLPHRCGRGICGAWSLGMRLWERRGKGITKSNVWILAVQIPTCSTQVVVPACSFAHLHRKGSDTVWPDNSAGYRYAWFKYSSTEPC